MCLGYKIKYFNKLVTWFSLIHRLEHVQVKLKKIVFFIFEFSEAHISKLSPTGGGDLFRFNHLYGYYHLPHRAGSEKTRNFSKSSSKIGPRFTKVPFSTVSCNLVSELFLRLTTWIDYPYDRQIAKKISARYVQRLGLQIGFSIEIRACALTNVCTSDGPVLQPTGRSGA